MALTKGEMLFLLEVLQMYLNFLEEDIGHLEESIEKRDISTALLWIKDVNNFCRDCYTAYNIVYKVVKEERI